MKTQVASKMLATCFNMHRPFRTHPKMQGLLCICKLIVLDVFGRLSQIAKKGNGIETFLVKVQHIAVQ